MPSRTKIRIAAAALALLSQAAMAAPPTVTGLTVRAVKFWSLGNTTRIAIEVSDEFQYRKDRLDNPNRMFVDIVGAQPRIEGATPRGQHLIPVNDRFIKQIRVAEPKAGITRVVLDLEPGAECVTSQLSGPDRLMIEVTAPGVPDTPTVTPSVVVIKQFEPPPPVVSRRTVSEIKTSDDPAPVVAMRQVPANPLPASKQRKLVAAAPKFETPPAIRKTAPTIKTSEDPVPVIATRTVAPNSGPTPKERKLLASATGPKALPAPPPIEVESETELPAKAMGPLAEGAPLPAKRNAAGDRSMTRVFGLKIKRVIIDAGHGGTTEKELVMDVARRVGTLVEERLGVEVVYTRSDDTFIPLERRTEIANEKRGDLFLSIHANASPVKSVSGVEIYYLNFSNSRIDLETAARENAGSDSSVHELETLLQKAMLNDKLKESSEFAGKVLQAMVGPATTPASAAKARNRGVRRAPFVVLIGARMPSILAEIGFITNPADEARMAKTAQRQKIAESLAQGIQDFVQSLSRFQVAAQPGRATTARPSAAAGQ